MIINFKGGNEEPLVVSNFKSIPANGSILLRNDEVVQIEYQKDETTYLLAIPIKVKYPVGIKVNYLKKNNYKLEENISLAGADIVILYNDGAEEIIQDINKVIPDPKIYNGSKLISFVYNINGEQFITKYEVNKASELAGYVDPRIVTFASGTKDEIEKMLIRHRNGEINVADYWKVGDKRNFAGENAIYTILDFNVVDDEGTKFIMAVMNTFSGGSIYHPSDDKLNDNDSNCGILSVRNLHNAYRYYTSFYDPNNSSSIYGAQNDIWKGVDSYPEFEYDNNENILQSINISDNRSYGGYTIFPKRSKYYYPTTIVLKQMVVKNTEYIDVDKSYYATSGSFKEKSFILHDRSYYNTWTIERNYYLSMHYKKSKLKIEIKNELYDSTTHALSKKQVFGGSAFEYFKTKSNLLFDNNIVLRDVCTFDNGEYEKEIVLRATKKHPNTHNSSNLQGGNPYIADENNYKYFKTTRAYINKTGELVDNLATVSNEKINNLMPNADYKIIPFFCI